MTKLSGPHYTQPHLYDKVFVVLWFLIALLLAAACTVPAAVPVQPSLNQPDSPLIPGTNTTLIDNRWRLIELTQHSNAVAFQALGPVYLYFQQVGGIGVNVPACNGSGFWIMAESEHTYRLIPTASSARDCGALKNMQYARMLETIGATTEYALQNNQLFLTGPDVHVVLEIDNAQ